MGPPVTARLRKNEQQPGRKTSTKTTNKQKQNLQIKTIDILNPFKQIKKQRVEIKTAHSKMKSADLLS